MSNLAINIRLWRWHWQVTFDGKSTFKRNNNINGQAVWYRPVGFYDFRPWEIRDRE